MKYVLDTNVCIRLLKGTSPQMKQHIVATVRDGDVCVPSIVRCELYYGAYKSNRKEQTLNTLNDFFSQFETALFDDSCAKLCGEIRANLEKQGLPIGPYDLLIAATAIRHGLILVTHNTNEFSRVKQLVIEDWEG